MEVLARLGVEAVVASPGSRSAPLIIAADRNPRLETLTFLDERSASFFALGLAKRTQKPVALVCTSGTAAANYMPAVVEASMSGVPLLVLTADRPPEDRACSSGQTIDQIKLFGQYPRAFIEMALPETDQRMLDYLRQTLVHAVERACKQNPGPVHLNFPFRDPLHPQEGVPPVITAAQLEKAATVINRITEAVPMVPEMDTVALERMSSHRRGLIVVGDISPIEGGPEFAQAVAGISEKMGWPVLSDVLNPLRSHAEALPALITHYDTILRDRSAAESLQPAAVLQVGPLPTSKQLRQWLKETSAMTFLLSPRPINTDPLHRLATPLLGTVSALAEALQEVDRDVAWSDAWQEQEGSAKSRIGQALDAEEALFEGKVARIMSQSVPIGSSVFLASSMSVRYAESFWTAGNRAVSIFANRGANGIDGTISSALGVAHQGVATFLLSGDLAFLHDSSALLLLPQFVGSLTIVVINNRGGGIFEHLPVANQPIDFERLFATPQEIGISSLCKAHGLAHTLIEDWQSFSSEIGKTPLPGVRVLELCTDRKADCDRHRRLVEPA